MMKAGEKRVYELERKREKLCRLSDRCVLRAGKLDRIAAKAWSNVAAWKARIDGINEEIAEARTVMARTLGPEPCAACDHPDEQAAE